MFNKHPKGLIPAALSNMGERFGYYIMNAVLVLFLCSKFGISEEKSTLIYSFLLCRHLPFKPHWRLHSRQKTKL